jgi:hypothetical protein
MPGRPVVTFKMVVAMREDKVGGGWTNKELATRYGVSPMTVSRITTGEYYADYPGPTVPKRHQFRGARCWRGHPLDPNRITYGNWTGCKLCKRIRNREYMRGYNARQRQGAKSS